MSEELEILIRWEIGILEDQLDELKKDLRTLMIDRNTAALRVVAMEKAGLPYPTDNDDVASLDLRVEELTGNIHLLQQQIAAWKDLLQAIKRPEIESQITPMIRTVELQREHGDKFRLDQ